MMSLCLFLKLIHLYQKGEIRGRDSVKRSKLFKRASSLVTALLVFSMCFAGLAYAAEGTITAGTATVTAVKDAEGLYEVTVPYTASNVGSLGVTLLAFSKGSAAGDAWTVATAPAAYTDDMQIVGIDQTDVSTSITFVISTNSSDSIKMAEGETGVILLGGDGVSAPSKTTFTVPSNEPEPEVWVADKLEYTGDTIALGEITVASGASDDVKKAAVIDKALETVTKGNQTFTYRLTTDSAKLASKSFKNLTVADVTSSTAVKTAEGEYTVTLTIAAGVKSDDNSAITGTALTLTVPVTATITEKSESDVVVGDINGDGNVDIDDAILLFNHSMMPDLFEISYTGNIDFTKDGNVDIEDAILLFNYSMMPDLFPIE